MYSMLGVGTEKVGARDADLTARARIRNAALRRFADEGAKGTTIRGVAELAGVSPALVQHHFRSKEGLRQACDDYVMEYVSESAAEAVERGGLGDPAYISATYGSATPVMRYLARALVDGTPAATAMFDRIVDLTERHLDEHAENSADDRGDHRAQAAVFAAMKLGITVLHEHVSRAVGTDVFTPEGMARTGAASLNVISPEFVGADVVELARDGLAEYRREKARDENASGEASE